MDYFISDLHFGHKNIIRFCRRPFRSVVEMDDSLIKRWNSVITDKDRVFVIGDVFICDDDRAKEIMSSLLGYKILIKGNHDKSPRKMISLGFDEAYKKYDYKLSDGRVALLKHYPVPDILLSDYDLMIHGHLHNGPRCRGKKINVACDLWDFMPIDEIKISNQRIVDNKEYESFSVSVDDEKNLTVNMKIPMFDFSGATDEIYSLISDKWPKRKEQ
jgi:calcineurin-like phosphoesterase family protein